MAIAMNEAEVASLGKTTVVDARGVACPWPHDRGQEGDERRYHIGEVMELWSGDSQTKEDMGYWTEMAGHEFLGVIPARGYDRLFIRRGK